MTESKARRLDARHPGFEDEFRALMDRDASIPPAASAAAAEIVTAVRARGDAALAEYTLRFDGYDLAAVGGAEVDGKEVDRAAARAGTAERAALERAAARIRAYHERQLPADAHWSDGAGIELGWRWRAVERVGVYAPGGRARYPSSVLMSAIPAKVAGAEQVVLATPAPAGSMDPLVMLAARVSGIDAVYRIGGAQAIAALAFGTRAVPRCDVVVGPGKRLCRRRQADRLRRRRHRRDRRPIRADDHRRRRLTIRRASPPIF